MKQFITKILFVIQPQSIVDVITNSSSELFIFEGKEKEVIEQMISNIYPNYREEYQQLQAIEELDAYAMYEFLSWCYEVSSYDGKSHYTCIAPGGIDIHDITELASDKWDLEWYQNGLMFSKEKIKEQLIPLKEALAGTFLLYSIHDNPDFEMQEKLEMFGTRHHLG